MDELFQRIAQTRCLVIGDVMLDRYITGTCDRISPEAPVPVVLHHKTEDRLGGAANVALNLERLGAEVNLCAVYGADENGSLLDELIADQLGATEYMFASGSRQTTVKTRVIAHNQHLLRVDREDIHPLTSEESRELSRRFHRAIDDFEPEVVVLQDYNKGMLQEEMIDQILSVCRSRGIFTAVDPKFEHFFEYGGCHLFKPNLKEIRQALQRPIAPVQSELDRAAEELRQSLPHQFTCITLSEQGIYLHDGTESCVVATTPRTIVDVCGAGDAVLAILAVLMPREIPLKTRGKLANTAGGQVCEQVGVMPLNREQLAVEYRTIERSKD